MIWRISLYNSTEPHFLLIPYLFIQHYVLKPPCCCFAKSPRSKVQTCFATRLHLDWWDRTWRYHLNAVWACFGQERPQTWRCYNHRKQTKETSSPWVHELQRCNLGHNFGAFGGRRGSQEKWFRRFPRPSQHCRGELDNVFPGWDPFRACFLKLFFLEVGGRLSSLFFSVILCIATSCALQDIASGSTAFRRGTNATLRCRVISFGWRCSGLVPSKLSLQMLLSSCAAQCELKGS